MSYENGPNWAQGGMVNTYPNRFNRTRTETTVVEEENYDADGKLTGKSKTTTTRTWTEPDAQPYTVTY